MYSNGRAGFSGGRSAMPRKAKGVLRRALTAEAVLAMPRHAVCGEYCGPPVVQSVEDCSTRVRAATTSRLTASPSAHPGEWRIMAIMARRNDCAAFCVLTGAQHEAATELMGKSDADGRNGCSPAIDRDEEAGRQISNAQPHGHGPEFAQRAAAWRAAARGCNPGGLRARCVTTSDPRPRRGDDLRRKMA